MSEYWVSQAKHYCKYCNCWTQGDPVSIQRHESAVRHKSSVQRFLKDKRRAKVNEEHQAREVQKQLKEIEKQAQNRFAKDLRGNTSGNFVRPSAAPSQPQGLYLSQPTFYQETQPSAQEIQEDEGVNGIKGSYMIRGDMYLEGNHHEEKLRVGRACEYWVEQVEDWLPATVDNIIETKVPNTTIVLRKFFVKYRMPNVEEDTIDPNVKSEQIRIKLSSGTSIESLSQIDAVVQQESRVDVDENTGLGEWSTVSVTTLEEEEIPENETTEETAPTEQAVPEQVDIQASELQSRFNDQDYGDSALGAYNPFSSSYKGVSIAEANTDTREPEELEKLLQPGKSVGFKKRKGSGGANKKKRTRKE